MAGALGGTLQASRALNYLDAGDGNRKMCSLFLSITDRLGMTLDRFRDAEARLEKL